LVAGATGNLGERKVKALLKIGAEVRFIVRSKSDINKINMLEKLGAKVFRVKIWNVEEVSKACQGVSCVVSAIAGLHDAVIDAQKFLLDSAIAVGVPCFIPSDF
jgi:putative NADH-flavin reductase